MLITKNLIIHPYSILKMKPLDKLRRRLKKTTPRWVIFAIDLYVVGFAFILSLLIIWQLDLLEGLKNSMQLAVSSMLFYPLSFIVFKIYRGVVRHTSLVDMVKVFKASSLAYIALLLTSYSFQPEAFKMHFTIITLHYLLSLLLLSSLRIFYKIFYEAYIQKHKSIENVLIYGAGTSGVITFEAVDADFQSGMHVVAFIDDNRRLHNNKIKGIPVIYSEFLEKEFLEKEKIKKVIISIQNIKSSELNKIAGKFEGLDVGLKIVPPVHSWIDGTLETKQIQEVKIEDLLGRKPIKIEKESIHQEVSGKVVMVTGAAGSIGSEIARQLINYPCKQIILVDQAESALYEEQQNNKVKVERLNRDVEYVIGNIRDPERVNTMFCIFKPDIVYHAAAYKHVPLMENNPYESISTNIKGTKLIVDAAIANGTEKFVMVSTDKAVNPTNVMGATKRVAELYVTHQQKQGHKTQFVITRFGNVLGSNGSVIPLFRKQIIEGRNLTVTHPEVTRYFMTIPEACQLVLEAGAMSKGGEIYVFDMGDSMKIIDLAKRMIQLSGLRYPEDLGIDIVGLRPGEKIFEELLSDGENTVPTHHEKIMIARLRENNISDFEDKIEQLICLRKKESQEAFNFDLVRSIKALVPEFKSNNSIYQELD